MVGITSLGLLTTGALSVQAYTMPYPVNVSVPGLNSSSIAAPQEKSISNKDGYLNIYTISGDNKMDGRAEQGKTTKTGPWVRFLAIMQAIS